MATKTKANPAADVAAIEEQLEAARQEHNRLDGEARAWLAEGETLERGLSDLARTDPDQFQNGFPKPKTAAAGLQAEIEKRRNGHKWDEILGGSAQRVRNLEAELSRTRAASADVLARREYFGPGKAAVEKFREAATLIREAAVQYRASTARQVQVAFSCVGLDGRDVAVDPVADEADRLADRLAQAQPPRPATLVPLTDEDPLRVKSIHGGYIGAGATRPTSRRTSPSAWSRSDGRAREHPR